MRGHHHLNITISMGWVMIGIDTGKVWQGCNAVIRYREFCQLGVMVICMMLCACMNQNNGDGTVLKSTASEVFKNQGAAVVRLAEAAAKGDRLAIQSLVQQGVDVNAQGESNFSVLEWALLNKNVDGVLALLEAGADPTLTDDWGYTAMHFAAGIEDPKPLQALLDATRKDSPRFSRRSGVIVNPSSAP